MHQDCVIVNFDVKEKHPFTMAMSKALQILYNPRPLS